MDATDAADVETTRSLAIEELDRMGGLVQDLIVLAKARRPDFVMMTPTDLDAVVVEALEKARVIADRDWSLAAVTPLRATADQQRLTQALLQLASNAVAVTSAGDPISFGLSLGAPDRARLWVKDSGPGVPAADRQRIFDRAVSGAGVTTGGTGLGLAIVMAIAQAHGGTAYVEDACPSGGALLVIEIPYEPSREAAL